MGSIDEANPKLPLIDFSNPDDELKPGTLRWESLKSQVREAMEEYGCFEASLDDDDDDDDGAAAFSALQELFDLPLSTKQRNVAENSAAYHGYMGQFPQLPLYESMGIDDFNLVDKVDTFTTTFWPQGNPGFSKTLQTLSEKVLELDETVRKMILESFGVEKYMEEHMASTKYVLRVMKYDGPQTADPTLGLKAHTDKSMITILHHNRVEGLQTQTKSGQWIKFRPSCPSSFVVMAGDSLYVWLNGRVQPPHHRVIVSGNERRYTFGYFRTPKPGCIIKAPQELVDEQHPQMFKPFELKAYLAFAYAQPDREEGISVRQYCGL